MRQVTGFFTPNRVWAALFAVWLVLLSGVLPGPGVVQALRLQSILDAKQFKIDAMQQEIARVDTEARRLETSRAAQEREIRRVLGYAAPDELIFDFTEAGRIF